MEATLQPLAVSPHATVVAKLIHIVDPPHRPRVNGRI